MKGKVRLTRLSRRDLVMSSALLMLLGAGAWLVQWQPHALQGQAGAVFNRLYAAEPGEGAKGESEKLLRMDAYWQARVTYPTGNFNRAWLDQAAAQDRANVRAGVPAGHVQYGRGTSQSPLSLDPT